MDTFCSLEINWSNLFWADLESRIQFWPKLCIVFQCHKVKLLWRSFCSGNLLFRQKKETKSDIWILFALLEQIDKFLGCLFGKQHSVLAQRLHGSSVSQNKTPEVWILNPLAHWKEIHQFFGGRNGKPRFSLCPNFAWPSVSEHESFVKVFRSTNLPFRKIKPRKFKFLNVAHARKKFTNFWGR